MPQINTVVSEHQAEMTTLLYSLKTGTGLKILGLKSEWPPNRCLELSPPASQNASKP